MSFKQETDATQGTVLVFSRTENPDLCDILADITNDDIFYKNEIKTKPELFEMHLEIINERASCGAYVLLELGTFLAEYFRDRIEQLARIGENNKITFDSLHHVFGLGKEFVGYYNGEKMGSIVADTRYAKTLDNKQIFILAAYFTTSDGDNYTQRSHKFYVKQFKGLKDRDSLEIKLMSEECKKELIERGKLFRKYTLGKQYVEYVGNMYIDTANGPQPFYAKGRCMVDAVGYSMQNAEWENSCEENFHKELSDDELFSTWAFVKGFSFAEKRWGYMYIKNISEPVFNTIAFSQLVMDENKKSVIRSLIMNIEYGFKDIVRGKSGGCIFLLHGSPGTGKTLTCEAVAEYLHKPLYSVTVGELGTRPDELEKQLVKIIKIADSWNAVVLIDEADIFLEKRSINELVRNAMVSVFLRLLERYNGVMFLTTNRAETIDEAFKSRISIMITYTDLDYDTRKQIWLNLLDAANISCDSDTIDNLVYHPLNGRQIKNVIRIAQSIAHTTQESVCQPHFDTAIRMLCK